jgi:capsular exopolysaccharide synthesis family protein
VDLRDYVRLLRVRRALIIACTLLGIAAAAALTLAAKPVYAARAQLFVSADDRGGGVGTAYTGSLFTQARVKSYAKVIDSPPIANAVIDELGLTMTADQLAAKVTADAPLDTVLLNVTVRDGNPVVAQRIANSVATNFTKLVGQLETQTQGGQSLVKLSVVKPAGLPRVPVSPNKKLNLALGFLVGISAGVGAAVARETLDQSVRGVEEMQSEFGLATLGVIAYDADAPKRPLIVQVSPHSPRAEAFRQLRTNLQFVDVDHRPRSIVITSSVPQEGKTTTTCNLAITIADSGVPVVLVEGDLRRPRVGDYMGLEGAVGLTDVLIGRASLDDVLQPWGDGNLKVLLSGPLPPNPSELLGSRLMADLLEEIQGRGLVIIDAPPLLPVTDAAVLSTVASGTVVVVAAQRTHREQVRQAVDLLRGVDAHVFGAVFNMAPAKGPDAYRYGYGYGYGYGYAPKQGRERLDEPVPIYGGREVGPGALRGGDFATPDATPGATPDALAAGAGATSGAGGGPADDVTPAFVAPPAAGTAVGAAGGTAAPGRAVPEPATAAFAGTTSGRTLPPPPGRREATAAEARSGVGESTASDALTAAFAKGARRYGDRDDPAAPELYDYFADPDPPAPAEPS